MACKDVQDVFDKLRLKAVSKIREFILQKINQFKKPMSNYQVNIHSCQKIVFISHVLSKQLDMPFSPLVPL